MLCATMALAKNSKDFSKKFKQAQDLFVDSNYTDALPLYLDLYKMDSSNANINYKLGYCYAHANQGRPKAVKYLERAVTATSGNYKEGSEDERNAPLDAYFRLGEAYHFIGKFDAAIQNYEKYKLAAKDRKNAGDEALMAQVDRKIQISKNAKTIVSRPIKIKIQNMGKNVNSAYGDYAPIVTADQSTLIFTSRRPETTGGDKFTGGLYFEDIYVSHRKDSVWGPATNIGAPINTESNEASVAVSLDGSTILIYRDDNGDGNIYATRLKGDQWSTPEKLNANVNSKSWEPSAWISPDGNTLYFSSDRPGGLGGKDLYKSLKADNGDWGDAINLGPTINTPYDEDGPFIHPDGVTLFFSSNGHQTMGGYDVFYSTLAEDGSTWSDPTNVGYPVNSTDDDIFFVVSPDNKRAYYTSLRAGGYGDKDNYMVSFEENRNAAIALLRGTVLDQNGKALDDVKITVTDNATGKVVGVYNANTKTGKYLFVLRSGKNYNISYEAKDFLFYSYNVDVPKKTNYFEIVKEVQLPRIIVGSVVVLENLFFDYDKASLTAESQTELNNILKFLNENPNLIVQIAGYTDSKGSSKYNKSLSVDRAKSVVAQLVSKGVEKKRLVAKGYGELEPNAPNQKEDGTDNPEGRQLNRRVELKIIEVRKEK